MLVTLVSVSLVSVTRVSVTGISVTGVSVTGVSVTGVSVTLVSATLVNVTLVSDAGEKFYGIDAWLKIVALCPAQMIGASKSAELPKADRVCRG
jgi:hypothetical protein